MFWDVLGTLGTRAWPSHPIRSQMEAGQRSRGQKTKIASEQTLKRKMFCMKLIVIEIEGWRDSAKVIGSADLTESRLD